MTTSHLMLSATMTVYIFIGVYLEERDLMAALGQDDIDDLRPVPMLPPIPKITKS